ncbi:MAG: DUF4294 domain-containing protein [Bacteroidales bacterium]|nr:DUF4294 domain-containing protein [Bacteroidales bacterium]MCF8403391.1 DUF4294 domain-containing protein [Bacteroidales bacterium]
MLKKIIISAIIVSSPLFLFAQETESKIVLARIVDGDTIITINLPEYVVNRRMPRKLKALANRNSRLVYNVKKAYPYAKLAGIKLNEYEEILKNAKNDAERRRIMKLAEDELREEFEDDLKKLTFKQGAILIKLVDRETGNSSYVLVQELRGKFMAFFWQTFARLFGYNLKEQYDPEGEDREIEEIVVLIEKGEL